MISPELSRRAAVAINDLQLAGRADEAERLAVAVSDAELESLLQDEQVIGAVWDETRHPRESRGRREGGRFRSGKIENATDDAQPDTVDVTVRRLKPGQRFIAPNGEEYEVVEGAGGLGRYVTVRRVTDGKPAIIKSAMKVTVPASDFPEELAKLAKSQEMHVTGELEKVFATSPGAKATSTKLMNEASARIGQVLELPDDLPKMTLAAMPTSKSGEGQFTADKLLDGSIVNGRIELKTNATANAAVHEVGHYLDHMGLDRGGTASNDLPVAEGVMTAIENSVASQRITDMAGMRNAGAYQEVKIVNGSEMEFPIDQGYRSYTSDPQEKFARAFEQYISTKTGEGTEEYSIGAAMTNDYRLDPGDNLQAFYGWYWTGEDFEPISAEMDKMFKGLGWLKN